ncbi:MAG: peptide chain release factor 3 [Bacteroidetes bacterium]|jgi:peptide chain release factor 3|nr:peptide chain release factor 3 [Bacteroidota bacterium]
MSLEKEIQRRRTFAIIAHPDAGKTTLTEKLLLFGGAIQVAGAVKSNKIKKTATSDFMEIEKQRGISVATSVMGFEYKGLKINILDTPGHQDFAEDTYRTLTAVDSVIVVIDVAKGVEPQTEKLVQVCRMRETPIIVFINKLDRVGKDAFDLLDEVEEKLGLHVLPLTWPIGMGKDFKGVYNLYQRGLVLYEPNSKMSNKVEITNLQDPIVNKLLYRQADTLREEVDLITGVYEPLNVSEYQAGALSPVFFGSAVNNFGVAELLDCFAEIAPCPKSTATAERVVAPNEERFSGFVFKIHANMDPKHRDRIAFMRVNSGVFLRGNPYLHVRSGKRLRFANPTAFMADKKDVVDEAFPGDIVGLHDTGTFVIGDTLTDGEMLHFKGMPSFSPELFKYVENGDPMKSKQLWKGVDQLMDEGVAQLFTTSSGRKVIGTVGQLQFEVIEYRLKHEYGATCIWEPLSMYKACWITSDYPAKLVEFKRLNAQYMATDKHGRDVYLANSEFRLQMERKNFSEVNFHFTSEF